MTTMAKRSHPNLKELVKDWKGRKLRSCTYLTNETIRALVAADVMQFMRSAVHMAERPDVPIGGYVELYEEVCEALMIND